VAVFGVAAASGVAPRRGSRATKESGDDGRLSYVSGPPTDELVENIEANESC